MTPGSPTNPSDIGSPRRSPNALGVLFEPGARTDWPTHPDGRVLYVALAPARYRQKRKKTVRLSAGDVAAIGVNTSW